MGEGKSLKMQSESRGDVEYRCGDEGGGRRRIEEEAEWRSRREVMVVRKTSKVRLPRRGAFWTPGKLIEVESDVTEAEIH